jgi:hypothetical protein
MSRVDRTVARNDPLPPGGIPECGEPAANKNDQEASGAARRRKLDHEKDRFAIRPT